MKENYNFPIKLLGLFVFLMGLPSITQARNTFHYEDPKTGFVTILTDQKDPTCENGYLSAFTGSFALKKWYPKASLCYKVDANKRLVVLKDPAKWVFGSYKISADYFSYIPSAQEQAAQKDKDFRINFARQVEQINRNITPSLNRVPQEDSGIRALMLNGDLKTCIKTGSMLDCD